MNQITEQDKRDYTVEILVARELQRVVEQIVDYLREEGYPITANEVLAKWGHK